MADIQTIETEVLVVGGGPVGLALAALAGAVIVLYRRRIKGHRPLHGVGDEGH